MSHAFHHIEKESVQCFAPGEQTKTPRAGDFILTHSNAWTSQLIHIGQKFRYQGSDSKYTYWNHAALIINTHGDIIEAVGSGVRKRNLREYKKTEYHLVRIKASAADRSEAVGFATYALGEKYGKTTIVSIAISLITGLKLSFGFDGQQICSGLVARALERTPAIFSHDPAHITPADLAKYYQVEPTANDKKGN
jgi:uncharacterized protein YycO